MWVCSHKHVCVCECSTRLLINRPSEDFMFTMFTKIVQCASMLTFAKHKAGAWWESHLFCRYFILSTGQILWWGHCFYNKFCDNPSNTSDILFNYQSQSGTTGYGWSPVIPKVSILEYILIWRTKRINLQINTAKLFVWLSFSVHLSSFFHFCIVLWLYQRLLFPVFAFTVVLHCFMRSFVTLCVKLLTSAV